MGKCLAKIDWNNTLKNRTATECWNILKSEIGKRSKRNAYRKKPLEKSSTSK